MRFFLARARRPVRPRGRPAVLPFPLARGRSVSRHGAARRRHLGRARALHALAAGTRGCRRLGGGAAAPGQRAASACSRRPSSSSPARTSRRPISASCWSMPGSPARIRPTSTASSRFAAAFVDVYPGRRAQPVRLEFIGDTIESLRAYDPATQRSIETDRPGRPSCRCATCCADDRSGVVLRLPGAGAEARIIVSEPDEVEAHTRSNSSSATRSEAPAAQTGRSRSPQSHGDAEAGVRAEAR